MVSSLAPNNPKTTSIDDKPMVITITPTTIDRIIAWVAISLTISLFPDPMALEAKEEVPTPKPITMPPRTNQTGKA